MINVRVSVNIELSHNVDRNKTPIPINFKTNPLRAFVYYFYGLIWLIYQYSIESIVQWHAKKVLIGGTKNKNIKTRDLFHVTKSLMFLESKV